MANHKSAVKRARQNEIRRMRNRSVKTRVKNIVQEVQAAASATEKTSDMDSILNQAKSIIAKAAKKGVIHKNTAARKISRLTKGVNSASA